jgi:hypothetical protein
VRLATGVPTSTSRCPVRCDSSAANAVSMLV